MRSNVDSHLSADPSGKPGISPADLAYLKIQDQLIADIASGLFHDADRLPSERALAERFHVARTTIRQAILHLEGEGRVFRTRRGLRGWFIAPPALCYDPTQHRNFHRNALAQNRVPDAILLGREAVAAEADIARMFGLREGTRLFTLTSIATLEGRKVCFERNFLLPAACPDFVERPFYRPLTGFLEQEYGLFVTQIGFRARAARFSQLQAQALDVTPDTPALHIRRLKAAPDGRIVHADDELWIASAIELIVGSVSGPAGSGPDVMET